MSAVHCAGNAMFSRARRSLGDIKYLINIRSRGALLASPSLAIGYPITLQSVLSANGIEDRRDKSAIKSSLVHARERIKARKPISEPRPAGCLLINEPVLPTRGKKKTRVHFSHLSFSRVLIVVCLNFLIGNAVLCLFFRAPNVSSLGNESKASVRN